MLLALQASPHLPLERYVGATSTLVMLPRLEKQPWSVEAPVRGMAVSTAGMGARAWCKLEWALAKAPAAAMTGRARLIEDFILVEREGAMYERKAAAQVDEGRERERRRVGVGLL